MTVKYLAYRYVILISISFTVTIYMLIREMKYTVDTENGTMSEFSDGSWDHSYCLQSSKVMNVFPSRRKCPKRPIVTVRQRGRLGNQIFEYLSVWAAAKKTGHDPYVPSCIILRLQELFQGLTIPPLTYIENCLVQKNIIYIKDGEEVNYTKQSIVLEDYVLLPDYFGEYLDEFYQSFRIRDDLLKESQNILHRTSRFVNQTTFVGVHVRRTDYKLYLKESLGKELLGAQYFLRHMNYFRKKYSNVLFVVMSDEPDWCEENLPGDDVLVMRNNSAELDLALMASCNHSIIDYGTYGFMGALMAGGETFMLKLNIADKPRNKYPKNWHVVNA